MFSQAWLKSLVPANLRNIRISTYGIYPLNCNTVKPVGHPIEKHSANEEYRGFEEHSAIEEHNAIEEPWQ